MQSVYDVLPSHVNLFTWGKREIPSCPISDTKGTLRRIMSACLRVLWDGRYCWRHDQVLRTVADTVDAAIHTNYFRPEAKPIYFVKAGECLSSEWKVSSCLLPTARDWQLRADIGERLKVAQHIAITTLRLDLILWSTETRQVVQIELTVSWEINTEVSYERKFENYQELVEQCKSNKWQTSCYSIEVGCQGFARRYLPHVRKKNKALQSNFRIG